MPKFTFLCDSCKKSIQKTVSLETRQCQCECGNQMNRQLPNLRGIKTTELVDKFMGKSLVEDQDLLQKERMLDFYWKYEVPKMVKSGIYSIETMVEKNWIYLDEKQQVVIRTKPLEKS